MSVTPELDGGGWSTQRPARCIPRKTQIVVTFFVAQIVTRFVRSERACVRACDLRNLSASVPTISSRQKTKIRLALAMATALELFVLEQQSASIIYS